MKRKNSLQGSYCLMQGALWGTYGFLFSYANRYFLDKGLTNFQAGLILTLATALSFLSQPLLTQIVDKTRLSCRSVMIVSSILMGLCSSALLLPMGLPATIALYAAASVCLQVLPSFSNALGMAAMGQGYRLNFGIARGTGSVSFGICSLVGNVLISGFDFPSFNFSGFGFACIPLSTAAMSVLLVLSALPFPAGKPAAREAQPSGVWEFFRKNKKFALFLMGATLIFIGHNVLTNCMFQIAEYKGNGDAQGTALLISAFVELPAMFLFVRMKRWMNCGKWLCLSGVFFSLRLFLCWLLPGVGGLYAAQFTQMLGFALYAVSSVYYTNAIIPQEDLVKGQTYLGLTNTLGTLGAHFVGGALIDLLGVGNMLLCCLAVSLVGTCIFFLTVNKNAPQRD